MIVQWRTEDPRTLQRQLEQQSSDVERRLVALERETRGGVRSVGLDPVSIGPGEIGIAASRSERTMALRAPAVADIGRVAQIFKSNGESALHIQGAGCYVDGVQDGVSSTQRVGLSEFVVIPSASPGRAEWVWRNDGSQIFGEIYLPNANAAATVIGAVNTWYVAGGTTVLKDGDLISSPSSAWDMQLDAYGTHEVLFSGQFSISSASPNRIMRCAFAVNGVVQTDTEIQRLMSTVDVGAFGIAGSFSLTRGDVVDVRLLNETAATNLTLEYGTVTASEAI